MRYTVEGWQPIFGAISYILSPLRLHAVAIAVCAGVMVFCWGLGYLYVVDGLLLVHRCFSLPLPRPFVCFPSGKAGGRYRSKVLSKISFPIYIWIICNMLFLYGIDLILHYALIHVTLD